MSTWIQKEFTLPQYPRGFHLVHNEIISRVPEIKKIRIGIFHLHIMHTSASITLNENADPSVRVDMESLVNTVVPESFPYTHDDEGSDDMPAHVKASLFGSSLSLPIKDGKLKLGTWQGIWLGEHRDYGGSRKFIATINGTE